MIFRKKTIQETPKPVSVTDLVREQLKGIKVDFNDIVNSSGGSVGYDDITEGMTETEKSGFLADMELLNNNDSLRKVIRYLINIQGNFTIREAQNEKQRDFGSATINGLELLRETIEALAVLYNRKEDDEPFDKHRIF